ncbi:hypothetical protein LUX29_17170 [Aureimonas altamirensis]|uniref:hypothetical protein n=1 Tax=Aureimonas altamirensis TaxID=370622 RepID=UPI001E3ABE55|nr:hypothetical protein [Aureimonas altamirensis]UHD44746.1 hypothetical protein LUX29_17170 [Aureimonas altamirensis]
MIAWFRSAFEQANRRVCERLANLPNIRETSLDDGLIEALIPDSAPRLLPSGAIVRLDTHNIGGLRRLGAPHWDWDLPQRRRWETADIAILVFVYLRDTLIAKKIGLLQSKRLFPTNQDVDDEDEIGFLHGMNAFIRRDGHQAAAALHRTYRFDASCAYSAIHAGGRQVGLIDTLNRDFGKGVYYLLYNPPELPFSVDYPLRQRIRVEDMPVGNRVLDADDVHRVLADLGDGQSPTFAQLQRGSGARNWPLETWAADLLLTCQVGQQFDDSNDDRVRYFLERRSGPIGAALAVSITLSDEA